MGAFRDAINNMRAAAAQAAEQRRAEEAAFRERMKPYLRGYDVFPDEVNSQYYKAVRSRLLRGVIIKFILLFLCSSVVTAIITQRYTEVILMLFFCGIAGLVVLLLFIANLTQFLRLTGGNFDCFGAMVTNKRIEEHTSTDSDGNTTTSYDYFVTLNGIECEVTSKEYRKTQRGQYTHFVRVNAKYRKNDTFYFFPCAVSDEQDIIGHHSPQSEPRLYRAEKGSTALTLFSVLCLLGSFVTVVWITLKQNTIDVMAALPLPLGLFGGAIVLAIINKCVGLSKGKKKIEEMKRSHDMQN